MSKPIILIILDGWGYTENSFYNAIHAANTKVWDSIWQQYPHTLISASGVDVGLPAAQMGNSEVGHMNIGSGRVVDQEFTRISKAINDHSFFENEVLANAFQLAARNNKAVHILGLLSPGGVHSHLQHIFALMQFATNCNIKKLYIHGFLDGRDTAPKSAHEYVHQTLLKIKELQNGVIASLIGRYYAMDRNKHWERTKLAYDLISQGKAEFWSVDPLTSIDMAYARGESDEFMSPTSITKNGAPIKVNDGDVMIFANYRSDRARQLARALSKDHSFKSFYRERYPKLAKFISLTSYKADYEFPVAFPPVKIQNGLGEYFANLGMNQLRIAETEKYAHVTFFFNGGEEQVFPKEDRILVPSPYVSTYDKSPEMSAWQITNEIITAIKRDKYDIIICNFANADMVGHTGNFKATIAAINTLDQCLGKIIDATKQTEGSIFITADHGNAEQLRVYTTEKIKSQEHKAHTSNPVPLIYVGDKSIHFQQRDGTLSDIAPSILKMMGYTVPNEMTGQSLISF